MKRFIDKKLDAWMSRHTKKPLLVRGARQVGKTYTVKAFGQRQFRNCIAVDLEQERSLHRLFAGDLHSRSILAELENHSGQRIVPGETLLFLDEIQSCPRAVTALRYLYEELPALHVIGAGSLLEFAMEDISFPVGRVEFLWMHPMTFSEFLLATGRELIEERRPGLDGKEPVSAVLHDKLTESLRAYFVVGGFPQAVSVYAETGSFTEISRIHQAIAQAYLQDFARYSPRVDRDCLEHVFQAIPPRVGQQIKYSALNPDKRVETIKLVLRILERALVIRRVASASAQGLPLGAHVSDRVFKYVFADIGLMRHMGGLVAAEVVAEKDMLNTFRGSLAEQFIGQELLAERDGSENDKLYYWARAKRNSSAEVDYLVVRNGKIWPVEVKSGPAGKLRSLQQFLAEHPQSPGGLVFHSGNVQDAPAQKMKFLPLYTRLSESGGEDRLSASETDLSAGRVHRGTADQLLSELKKEPEP